MHTDCQPTDNTMYVAHCTCTMCTKQSARLRVGKTTKSMILVVPRMQEISEEHKQQKAQEHTHSQYVASAGKMYVNFNSTTTLSEVDQRRSLEIRCVDEHKCRSARTCGTSYYSVTEDTIALSASHHDSSDQWEDNERQLTTGDRKLTNTLSDEDVDHLGDHTHVGERTHVIIGRDHITPRTWGTQESSCSYHTIQWLAVSACECHGRLDMRCKQTKSAQWRQFFNFFLPPCSTIKQFWPTSGHTTGLKFCSLKVWWHTQMLAGKTKKLWNIWDSTVLPWLGSYSIAWNFIKLQTAVKCWRWTCGRKS